MPMPQDSGERGSDLRFLRSPPEPDLVGGPQSVFIESIFRGEEIPIHGDGLQTRSFTYVSDTV